MEFNKSILIEWMKEFGEHGLFFLFFFMRWFNVTFFLWLVIRVLFEEFLIRGESHIVYWFVNWLVEWFVSDIVFDLWINDKY